VDRNILVTHDDRRQLGAALEDFPADGTERRDYLHALEAVLEDAQGIDPSVLPQDIVTMNTTVELRDVDTEESETYTVVYPERADITLNRISVLAPIGTAILGRRRGDLVEVEVPSGRRRIRVEDIHYQPERPGDFHL
jgi:regulator of nucleoside diphosphate kinase